MSFLADSTLAPSVMVWPPLQEKARVITPDDLSRLARGVCPNDGHHIFSRKDEPWLCQCGQVDTRNDPPRLTCPTCRGDGDVSELPEAAVPVSALRALVAQWRSRTVNDYGADLAALCDAAEHHEPVP